MINWELGFLALLSYGLKRLNLLLFYIEIWL